MPTVTADSYGIDFTGTTDVTAALTAAINAQPSGNTFQLHADGLYLTGLTGSVWTPTNVIVDGQGAYFFRNVRRSGDTATDPAMDRDIIQFNAPGSTLKNLNVYGFRKDVYTGSVLTTVAGSPTVAGTTVLLDALNEEVRLPQVGLDHKFAPNYFRNYETPFYFRGVDGLVRFEAILSDNNHVASDCVFSLIDDSNDAVLASSTLTLTGTPTTYSLTFDPIAVLDHRFRVQVKKATSTANTITVTSITPYGEAGFRWRGMSAPNTITGGNEFSDAISVVSSSSVTFDNIWVEGPDGDGFNLTNAGADCIVQNSTVRGAGRQCYTIEYSTGTTISNCNGFEGGRSGVDLEPQTAALSNTDTVIENCTFRNIRNYCISSGNWAKNLNLTLTNIMSISAGMGAMYGGGRGVSGQNGVTINGFTHLETTRTEADRILEGGGITTVGVPPPVVTDTVPPPGSHGEVDFLCWGMDIVGDNITTQIGVYIKDLAKSHASVSYSPDNVNLTNVTVTDGILDPPYVIEVANSSVSLVGGSTNAFDVSSGLFVPSTVELFAPGFPATATTVELPGFASATVGAFQDDAFQDEAFQDSASVSAGGAPQYIGTPFALSLTGQAVGAQVILGAGAGWDSDDITWDDTGTDWDAAGLGGQINQTGHVFAPSVTFSSITLGLINQNPVLYAPSVAAKFVNLGLINRSGFVHTPQKVNEQVTLGFIDNTGDANQQLFSTAQEVTLDLIDNSPTLYAFQLNTLSIPLPFINRSGFTFTPSQVSQKIVVGLITNTPTLYAPVVNAITLGFINQSGVAFELDTILFNPDDVVLDLIASTVEVFEPPLVNLPFQQTIRLDETAEQFIDNAGIVFAPFDFTPAAPQFVFMGFINRTGHTFNLRVFLPSRPTIVLHARYDPITVLHARYEPVILKHAMNSRQGD